MDFLQRSAAPEEEANPGEMTEFAAGVFERQPFRGYELRTVLASTDRTAVFKARDHTMERAVAIKVLRPCRERDGVVEEFFSLAGSIARLRCPGVARGLDVGRGDGDFFLVYEFVRGQNLADRVARLQTGRLSEKESLKVVMETARVLQSLFEHGHPHGHVTPTNIIQGEGGKVKLADVGFAWNMAWLDDAAAFRTNPHYLPPERIEGEFNIDVRGDLYSLGAIWFRLLAGRPVFEGETPEETLRMHLERKPPQLHKIDEKITESTSNLVRWLLEKDRDARPRTPKEFLRKLSSHPLLAGGGTDADDGERGGDDADGDGNFSGVAASVDGEPDGIALSVAREVEALIRGTAPDRAEPVEDAAAQEESEDAAAAGVPAIEADEADEASAGDVEDGREADADAGGGGEAVFASGEPPALLRLVPATEQDVDEDAFPDGEVPVPELSEAELFEPGQVLSLPRPSVSDASDEE